MKERLTGAIILVVLIVLLVPELLSGPSRSAPAPQAAVSSTEEPPLRSYTINLADDSHGASSSAETTSASAQASGPAQPTPITESPAAAQSTDSDAAAPPPAQNSATAASLPGDSWQEQPKPAPPHAQPPQQQRAAAPDKPAAQQRLSAADRAPPPRSPTERSSPPDRAAPSDRAETAERSASTGAWMVQLGVFSIQTNAERLAQELKTQGFHAFVSENGGGGRPLWRVRAGPVAERAAAEQLSAKLRAAGHAGSVVPK